VHHNLIAQQFDKVQPATPDNQSDDPFAVVLCQPRQAFGRAFQEWFVPVSETPGHGIGNVPGIQTSGGDKMETGIAPGIGEETPRE